jgi:hypothetical protein
MPNCTVSSKKVQILKDRKAAIEEEGQKEGNQCTVDLNRITTTLGGKGGVI